MKQIILLYVLVVGAAVGLAQTPVPSPTPTSTRLAWTHDGLNVDGFRVLSDGVVVFEGLPARATDGTYTVPFPALTPGLHVLAVEAFNVAGASGRATLSVRVVVVPSDPANLRIVVEAVP